MNSIQHLHCSLFSVSLLLSIILSASSMSSTALPTPHKVTTITTPTTEMSSSLDQNGTVTKVTSTSLTKTGTITTEISSSISQAGTSMTTVIYPSPTQGNSTDKTTTLLISAITPTDASNTTANSSSSETTATLMPSSVSVPTSQSAETTETTSGTSNSTGTTNTAIPVTYSSLPVTTVNTTSVTMKQEPPPRLTQSEMYLTIIFGVLLAVTVLTMVGYGIRRCRQKNSQYTHQPLHNDSEETRDNYSAPDDTLVISGGLYDGQGIFNSALTVNDDVGFHSDHPPFAPHPTQFRLEFLSEEPPNPTHREAPTLETFQSFDAKD
ncbi:hypothetical protein GJAV_G00192280 [Gymnothorax javanicus]|nr:hypothetical protein GJAV_G00192280 [Gymnothorax javanicus]